MVGTMSKTPSEIAEILVRERLGAGSFDEYPAQIPASLDVSYQIQDAAIKLWKSEIIGWKIGRLAPDLHDLHNTERLTGPIFKNAFKYADENIVETPIFENGFAAVEAEFVFEIAYDADINKTDYSDDSAADLICCVYGGIEMAGSPIRDINSYGPCVVASDFGNNFGLILGGKLADINSADDLSPENCRKYTAATSFGNQTKGVGGLFSMPGGPLKAIAWLAGHLAQRGHPLKKGQLISSGASTGIHDVGAGKTAKVVFGKNSKDVIDINIKTRILTTGDEFLPRN
jgi:2-keto-4-pentenoate hydratase